mgnify:CR=1 FL=1
MQQDLVVEQQRGIEDSKRELLRRFTEAVMTLKEQGVVLESRSGTEMVLFVGRENMNIVDIQFQNGERVKQIFVTVIGDTKSTKVEFNHMQKPNIELNRENFSKGAVDPKLRGKIKKNYPRFISQIIYDTPGTKKDMEELINILEQTKIDRQLLKRTVSHDTESGQYVKKYNSNEGNVWMKLLSAGKNILLK